LTKTRAPLFFLLLALLSLTATGTLAEEPQAAPVAIEPTQASTSAFDELLGRATELIGIPYRNGGISPATGFDCSGFVSYLFKTNLGMSLPRSSKDMSHVGEKVDKNDLQPGDLLFFKTMRRGISHVGIYMGDGKFIHSPWHGSSVEVAYLGVQYWKNRLVVAKRVELPQLSSPQHPKP
jgi:cell wall-associated NlpC family hydrolase